MSRPLDEITTEIALLLIKEELHPQEVLHILRDLESDAMIALLLGSLNQKEQVTDQN